MSRDWIRDAVEVLKRCRVCGEMFMGHRVRAICYLCAVGEND